MTAPTTYHLHEFAMRVYKIVAMIAAHSVQCVRSSPAITGKIDKTAIKIRVANYARAESRIDLDKSPLEFSPPVLCDKDLDPQSTLEYFVYYETIAQLNAFICKELQTMIDAHAIPARQDINRVVAGFIDCTLDKFLSQ